MNIGFELEQITSLRLATRLQYVGRGARLLLLLLMLLLLVMGMVLEQVRGLVHLVRLLLLLLLLNVMMLAVVVGVLLLLLLQMTVH